MDTVTCVLLGDALVLTMQFCLEGTTEDLCKRLIDEYPMVFEGLDWPLDLRLFHGPPWEALDETARRRFLHGDCLHQARPIAVDDRTVVSSFVSPQACGSSLARIVVEIEKLRGLEASHVVAQTQWLPAQTLHWLTVSGIASPHAFFHVRGLPFGMKIDPPDHAFVRACFRSVFNELVPSVRQAYEDESPNPSRVLVVTRPSGIGKRSFFLYSVFCFLLDDDEGEFRYGCLENDHARLVAGGAPCVSTRSRALQTRVDLLGAAHRRVPHCVRWTTDNDSAFC